MLVYNCTFFIKIIKIFVKSQKCLHISISSCFQLITGASPLRWMVATLLPLLVAVRGLRKRLFTKSGALLALVS
jgi:hypothetical protein